MQTHLFLMRSSPLWEEGKVENPAKDGGEGDQVCRDSPRGCPSFFYPICFLTRTIYRIILGKICSGII